MNLGEKRWILEVSWVVVQGGHFWHRDSLFHRFGQGRLRNVRLAVLNLNEISGMDPGGLRLESVISENLGFSPN